MDNTEAAQQLTTETAKTAAQPPCTKTWRVYINGTVGASACISVAAATSDKAITLVEETFTRDDFDWDYTEVDEWEVYDAEEE